MAEDLQFHPVVIATDTTDGQSGFFSRTLDAIGKGIQTAAISGTLSIYNTALDYAGKDAVNTARYIREYDERLGDFYEDNKETVDLAGLVGTSFVPGMMGVKALKLAQSGETLGAFGRVLGYTTSKKNEYFEKAMAEMARQGGTVTSSITAAKRAQLGWATADQVLTNTAFELAVVATMNDAPTFDNFTVGDFAQNVLVGAALGGVIGGVLDNLATRGILNRTQTLIEGQRRFYDSITDVAGLATKGQETLIFAEQIVKLPDDFALGAGNILDIVEKKAPGIFSRNGGLTREGLQADVEKGLSGIRTRAEKVAVDTLALKFNELAGGGEVPGQAVFEFMLRKVAEGKARGEAPATIVDTLQGYLQGTKKISALTEDAASVPPPKQFFINLDPKGLDDVFSEIKGPKTGKKAYYLATADPGAIKTGNLTRLGYDSIDEAFANGYDVVFNKSGHVSVNPKSKVVLQTPDAAIQNKYYLDLETGQLASSVKVTGADIMKHKGDFQWYADAVHVGKKRFEQPASKGLELVSGAKLRETRGTGERFHGTSNEITALDNLTASYDGSVDNIYGSGFYTTDALDVAAGYTKKGKGGQPTTYTVKEKSVRLFDMDAPLTPAVRDKIRKLTSNVDYTGEHNLATKAKTLREWFDEFRAESENFGLSKAEVQEIWGSLREELEELGYRGYKHKGGGKTGTKPHEVKIFWDPENDVSITKLDPKLRFLPATGSTLEHSARYMWASRLKPSHFTDRVIEWNDFPLIDAAGRLPVKITNSDSVKIKLADGSLIPLSDIVDIPRYANELKLEWLRDTLNAEAKGYDIRELAIALNVSRDWVEKAIASNFNASKQLLDEARPLEAYFNPQAVEIEWDNAALQLVDSAKGGRQSTPAAMGPNHMAGAMLGHHYGVMTRARVADNAFNSVFGDDAARFPDGIDDLIKEVSSRGAGAGMLTASSADYGRRAELLVQTAGKQATLLMQKLRDETIESISPQINAIRDSLESAAELGVLTTALRRDFRKYYLDISVADVNDVIVKTYRLVDREAYKMVEKGDVADLDEAIEWLQMQSTPELRIRGEYLIKNRAVGDFLEASRDVNKERLFKQGLLLNAKGIAREWDPEVIYAPPVDTRRYPYFAHVVAKQRIGAATDIAMITAKSEEELRQLASRVGDDYDVVYKADTEKYFRARGIYDYSMQINESTINVNLQKRGIYGDHFPETRAQNVLEDYVRWHANSSDHLVRTGVQVKYQEFISGLRFLSEQFQSASTSAAQAKAILKKNIADPFQDHIKTMLGISKSSEYPILEALGEFVDRIGTKIYSEIDAFWENTRGSPGLLKSGKDQQKQLDYVNGLMDEAGLGTPYKAVEEYLLANAKYPKNAVKAAFQKVNLWLATATIRLDFANSIINMISTPIMLGTELASIKHLIKNDPELVGKLAELTSVQVPGQTLRVPSTTKLIAGAIGNFFGADKAKLLERYTRTGDIKQVLQLYHEVLDDLSYDKLLGKTPSQVSAWLEKAVEKGATVTGNNFSEQFTRFISADVMRQLTEPLVVAGKMTVKEQDAYISTFVNRVQGNYTTTQRPIIFQGTTGAAIGLFQTYAFNVLQQLFRHAGNKDKRALLTFAGLQSNLYGMNGLPFFDAVNTHLIGNAAGNPEHQDLYSVLPRANKELGEWMLFGTASAFPLFGNKSPALYSRGDINPRHLTIIPVWPTDVPAVSASIKLVDSVVGFAKNVGNGADLTSSMLFALEHHGWNRPLAGFAQVLAGKSTTGKGGLISAANDLETTSFLAQIPERMSDFGGVSRIMGARPMDEAVTLHNLYRNKAYEAKDRARIEALGQAVKLKLAGNQVPDDEELEEFMQTYAKSGGRIETFSSAMQRWSKDANVSVINQMAQKLSGSSGKKLQYLIGGEPMQDYSNQE